MDTCVYIYAHIYIRDTQEIGNGYPTKLVSEEHG